MRRLAIFGATGSVGTQALDVVRAFPDQLEVCAVAARQDAKGLLEAVREFSVPFAALTSPKEEVELLAESATLFCGEGALLTVLKESAPDLVLIAVSGMAGLPLFAHCLREGIDVALANKEAIVAGGKVTRTLWDESSSVVLPVDSEHCAIFQCLGNSYDTTGVRRLWVTASGGPFLRWKGADIAAASPEQALAHPTWNMGRKITIDSASLANKGLEVIEAHFMYRMPEDRIKVVVQPKSLVHSMVEFMDSSVLAQFAPPDMRLPLQKALLFPEIEKNAGAAPLDFWTIGSVPFERPDEERFPCLPLAYRAISEGSTAVYNAADDAAVAAFLSGSVPFGAIPVLIEKMMDAFAKSAPESVEEILELDAKVRRAALAEAARMEEGS